MIDVFPDSSSLVYNTLLELLLQVSGRRSCYFELIRSTSELFELAISWSCQQAVHESNEAVRREKERRALELLQRPQAKYDIDHALILCQMNNFKDGILYLYGKAQLYQV